MTARGIIVAAPRSGSGKTTLTLALLAALRRRGMAVRGAKSGPDYIDPRFHEAACCQPSWNLDSWAMPPALLDTLLADATRDGPLVIVESAMGLFDGVDIPQPGQRGCAADLARRYGLPVLLVLDVSGQSQSAAAVARGFALHDPDVRLGGVVLNRTGSDRHRDQATRAILAAGIPVLGAIPRDAALDLPERHLGLVQAEELSGLNQLLHRLADRAETCLALDAIIDACAPLPTISTGAVAFPPPGQRIALARDAAFSFIYPHVLHGWRQQGADIVPFSPLADEAPPDHCDSCWLPGGYPELHAGRIAAANGFQTGLRRFAQTRPVHGECGGYMVLGAALEDASGTTHAMAGLLGHTTSFAQRRLNLGYRQARLLAPSAWGPAGATLRGHEFHYARMTDPGSDLPFAAIADAVGRDLGVTGGRRGPVSGSFFHAVASH